MPRTTKKADKPAAIEPDLTVSAVVTMICTPDGGADFHIKVETEGLESLVAAMEPATGKLNIIGATMRRIVLGTLGAEMDAPPVDLLAQRKVAGRA
jgi:hypothetical protein